MLALYISKFPSEKYSNIFVMGSELINSFVNIRTSNSEAYEKCFRVSKRIFMLDAVK